MNRRLRRRHQVMLTGLALLLPVGFALALGARPAIPGGSGSVAELGPPAPGEGVIIPQLAWGELAIRASYWPSSPHRSNIVELTADEDLALPDVLLYWSARDEGELQGDEVLLGSFFGERTQRYTLPEEAGHGGRLILYSLAHDEIVGTARANWLGN